MDIAFIMNSRFYLVTAGTMKKSSIHGFWVLQVLKHIKYDWQSVLHGKAVPSSS